MADGLMKVTVDDSDVQKGFDKMMTAAQKTQSFLRAIKPHIKADIRDHGLKSMGPDGPWPARNAEYMSQTTIFRKRRKKFDVRTKMKRNRKRAPRRILGKLTKSISQRVVPGALLIKSPIPWARAHQEGGVVGRRSVIPEREFLWLSPRVINVVNRAYAGFVTSAFPKGARAKIVVNPHSGF